MTEESENESRLRALLDGILGGTDLARREAPVVVAGAITFNAPVVLVGDVASARACLDGWRREAGT